MRILPVSDLHFEGQPDDGGRYLARRIGLASRNADCVVVAGDLADSRRLEASLVLLEQEIDVPILYVAGNHESYGADLAATRRARDRRVLSGGAVRWMDRTVEEIDGIRFVGCTLWYRWTPDIVNYAMHTRDFNKIGNLAVTVGPENERCLDFLNREVRPGDVVVTHHLPSHRSVPARFERSPLNPCYVCDCHELIMERAPALWIHGHTHDSMDYHLGKTRVVANPYGYRVFDENPAFSFQTVEV